MVAQHWPEDEEIFHESSHSMIIFKVKKELPRLKVSTVQLPTDKAGLDALGAEIAKEIDIGVGTKLDILYSAIKKASKTLNLVRTHKGYSKIRC